MNLRFIIRDGQRILQQRVKTIVGKLPTPEESVQLVDRILYDIVETWEDVPLVEGEEE